MLYCINKTFHCCRWAPLLFEQKHHSQHLWHALTTILHATSASCTNTKCVSVIIHNKLFSHIIVAALSSSPMTLSLDGWCYCYYPPSWLLHPSPLHQWWTGLTLFGCCIVAAVEFEAVTANAAVAVDVTADITVDSSNSGNCCCIHRPLQ